MNTFLTLYVAFFQVSLFVQKSNVKGKLYLELLLNDVCEIIKRIENFLMHFSMNVHTNVLLKIYLCMASLRQHCLSSTCPDIHLFNRIYLSFMV